MTMHKTLYSRNNADRRYVSRKEGGRGRTSIEDSIDASIQRLEDYIEKRDGRLLKTTRNNTDNTRTNRTKIARKQKYLEKQLYGRFQRPISDILHEKTWMWLRKRNLKRETASLLIATQNNAARTNPIKARKDKTQQNSRWRHDWVGKVIPWELCKKFKFDHTNKWYIHNSASLLENKIQTPLWFWQKNGSPNIGQTTRPYNNNKKELAELWSLLSRLTTE